MSRSGGPWADCSLPVPPTDDRSRAGTDQSRAAHRRGADVAVSLLAAALGALLLSIELREGAASLPTTHLAVDVACGALACL